MVGVGEALEAGYEGGEVLGRGRAGEQTAVEADTAGHGLVGGQCEGAGGAGADPGGVVVGGVAGGDRLTTVPTQEAAQVRAQLRGVETPRAAAVEVPDPGEVGPAGHRAEGRVLVARHYLLPGLDRQGGAQPQPASVCVAPGVGEAAVGEEAEHGEEAQTPGLPSCQGVAGGRVRQDYPW